MDEDSLIHTLSYCTGRDLLRWRGVCTRWRESLIPRARKERREHLTFIEFDETGKNIHTYYFAKKPISKSVTGLIKDFSWKFDPDAVVDQWYDGWQAKQDPRYAGKTKEEIKAMWAENGRFASSMGKKLHEELERANKGEPLTETSKHYAFSLFKQYERQHIQPRKWTVHWVEKKLYYDELDLAGSADIVYRRPDGKLAVYDWKRSKGIKKEGFQDRKMFPPLHFLPDCNYSHYCLQLNLYARMIEVTEGEEVGQMALVILHPQQPTWQVIPVPWMRHEVDLLLQARRQELQIEKAKQAGFDPNDWIVDEE